MMGRILGGFESLGILLLIIHYFKIEILTINYFIIAWTFVITKQ